jgi:hypothetical protein
MLANLRGLPKREALHEPIRELIVERDDFVQE